MSPIYVSNQHRLSLQGGHQMNDPSRKNPGLIEKISVLEQKIKELEQMESARKRVEEALRKSEERYRTLVEYATDIVFRTDDTGHFTLVNPAVLRITGYEEKEIIGKHYPTLIRPGHA
jgi:PAS domain-containing protein